MADTFTSFLNLVKPDPNTEIDVTKINSNMDLIDAFAGSGDSIPVVAPDALVGAYPLGISMFGLSAATISTYPAWAVGIGATSGEVITFRASSDRATQFWFRNGSYAEGFYRHMNTSAQTAWRMFGDSDFGASNGTSDISLVDATWTKILMSNSEGTNQGYNVLPGSGGFTCRSVGVYRVEAMLGYNGGGNAAAVTMGFGQSSDSAAGSFTRVSHPNPGAAAGVLSGSWSKAMTAGESVFMFAIQTSGGPKVVNTRRLTVSRVGMTLL